MSSLSDALQNADLIISGSIVADGQIHRCGTRRKPNGKNGWYAVHTSGKFASFGNWEDGDGHSSWNNGSLSDADYTEMRKEGERLKALKEKEREATAQNANNVFESLEVDGYSDYLKRKRIYPHGARFDSDTIVLPCSDADGKIWSLQRIYPDGSKYFMRGGRTQGCFFKIFPKRNVSKTERVIVCEGFATGATIHQETGQPVIVAFNAANIKPVCDSIPFRNILIAADNDKPDRNGRRAGEYFAKESGYSYVMPDTEGDDFNDMFLSGRDIKAYFINEATTEKPDAAIVGGIVGEIADWITATAIRPQPQLSLAAAIAFMGMVKGHRVRGKTNLRTNTLCLALAPTAAGKEHPQYAIDRLAGACGLKKHVMGRPTSGSGLLTGLEKAGRVGFLSVDEMGRYIGNITAKGAGGFQREIADYMVELFSCAGRTFYGRQYANDKMNPQIVINNPHFCCLGSTVPERMVAACSSAEVVDGFLNRWLVFSTDKRPEKQRGISGGEPPPAELVERIEGWLNAFPLRSDNYGDPIPFDMSFTPEAWDIFVAFDAEMEKAIDSAKYPMDKLYSRSAEHVEKLAMILADDEFIGTPEVTAAIAIVRSSNCAIMGFSGMISDNELERDFIRVREKIKDSGEIARGKLTYYCQFVQGGAKRIGEIVNILIDNNIIAERKVGNRTIYKWIAS